MGVKKAGKAVQTYLNKEEFFDIQQKKAESGELKASFCCLFFYIVDFRAFYMSNGFDKGLNVINSTGEIIKDSMKEGDFCNIQDNEFVIVTSTKNIEKRIKKTQEKFLEEWVHAGMSLIAGIYNYSDDDITFERSVDLAKIAAFDGQESVYGVTTYAEEQHAERARLIQRIISGLDEAIENDYIVMYYQPILHTLSHKICGYEALARWNDPEYGIILPADIVKALERIRKIHIFDSYVIRRVCYDLSNVIKKGIVDPVPISINLTRMDFVLTDMLDVIEKAVAEYNVPKELINVEISESEINLDRDAIRNEIQRFHDAGYRIAFDDFGSQYSSLHILNELPFDAIKINSSFLSGFKSDLKSKIMMKNVLNMAKELNINTMMGSVEDEEILDFLTQTGCGKSQGHLFSEALPMGHLRESGLDLECSAERKYYDELGAINVLSQTPMDLNVSTHRSESSYLNNMPISIMEFENGQFKILMESSTFEDVFMTMRVDDKNTTQDIFNDKKALFSRQVCGIASRCCESEGVHTMEFVTSEGFHRIMLKKVASYENKIALICTAETLTENDPGKRAVKLNSSLRFLYMLYNRVDLVVSSKDSFETVYENHSKYSATMKKGSFKEAIKTFAEDAIFNEDMERFIRFYDVSTIDERIGEFKGDHLTDYFRTKDNDGNYDWLMYLIIPIVSEGNKMFIMCSRSIESERMRKLPEISQTGSVYYDMPSDPAFLLLASDAFTDTLGYGSFEQFIRTSFYLEASLTDNKTVYMHLGQSGLISDFGETGYIELPFDEVIKGMVFSQVVESDRDKMYEFFDKDRLLSDYENGKISGNITYLERTGSSEAGRYQNACYQIRKTREDDKIHVYILTFDVDDYKRTNEKIIRLAQRDTLTGLYNRTTIGNVVETYMKEEKEGSFAVVLLDLDYFKQINDGFGHDCGDKVLQDAAQNMIKYMGEDSIPARIGGDEFLIVIKNKTEEEVQKILSDFSTMTKGIDYNGQFVKYTMSLGCAMYPQHGTKYPNLYTNADAALYNVKMTGKNSFEIYSDESAKASRSELGFNPATISEGLPGGFLVYKANDNEEILFANKKLIETYECDSLEDFKEFTKGSFRGCVLPEDYEIIEKAIDKEVEFDDGYDYVQYRAKTKTGRIIIIEDYGRLLHTSNDGDLFYVFMLDYEHKKQIYKKFIGDIHKRWGEDDLGGL